MNTSEDILPLLEMLIARLERLSADSNWAHRASGLRGSLLRYQEELLTRHGSELNLTPEEVSQLEQLMRSGFTMLEKAALEIDLPKSYLHSTNEDQAG
jgi:DNA-binding response OmpR family regulator